MEPFDKILVTGANGFIGTWLVKALLDRGLSVRAISRRGRLWAPAGFDFSDQLTSSDRLEIVAADVVDAPAMKTVAQGCTHVFHLAAVAKNWASDRSVFRRVNVQGARNVLAAAAEADVQRIVFTSTILTLGPTPVDVVHTEQTPRTTGQHFADYDATKSEGELLALNFAKQGAPVVVVNPTRVFGPGHLNESNSLSLLIRDRVQGRMPFLPKRGRNIGNYVFVDDVVEGHILAMEKGRIGQRYILGGENASLRQLVELVDQVSGRQRLSLPLPPGTAMAFSHFQNLRARWFGVYPRITPGWMRSFLTDWAFDTAKAQQELGYQPCRLEQGIRKTCQWLEQINAQCRSCP